MALDSNHNDQDDENKHQSQERHELHVLPPHLPLQPPAPDPKLPRAAPKPISTVNKEVNALAALEQALDIARHDAPDVVNLSLRRRDGIITGTAARACADLNHELPQIAIEARGAVVWQVVEVGARGRERVQEAAAYLKQVGERQATAEIRLGNDEKREPAGRRVGGVVRWRLGDVVDVVVAVRVGEFLRGRVVDLGEDDGREGRGLGRCRGGAFCQDGVVVRDAGAMPVCDTLVSAFILRKKRRVRAQ